MVTKTDVFECLESLGIKKTDKVTVHSSLKSVGEIENGADGLIDAFCEYLCDGLLIIPSHTWDNIGKTRFYDVNSTPACTGILSRVAVGRKDGKRSLHPTHSVVVFGKGGEEFIKGEEFCSSPAPVNSCLSRLYEEHGKILLIGVGHERNTFLHSVDERLKIPNRLSTDTISITIKDYNGNLIELPNFHWYSTEGVPEGVSEFFPNFEKPLEYCGATHYSSLGNARVCCCDAVKTVEIIKMLWKKANYDLCSTDSPIPENYYK